MADILDFTKPYVLRNEEDYDCAVAEIDTLLDTDPQPGSEAYERLEFLSVLVQAYEDTHVPAYEQSTPQEVVDFMLEQKGLCRDDLAKWLGSSNQTAEFFEGKRIMKLHVDKEANAVYLRLDDSAIVESEEVSPGMVFDYNASNEVVGVSMNQFAIYAFAREIAEPETSAFFQNQYAGKNKREILEAFDAVMNKKIPSQTSPDWDQLDG